MTCEVLQLHADARFGHVELLTRDWVWLPALTMRYQPEVGT